MTFAISYRPEALDELRAMPAADRARVMDDVRVKLSTEPLVKTRLRKPLPTLAAPWPITTPPVWQLHVGDWRVFYEADAAARTVTVWAVREKGRQTTGEIV